MTEPIQITNPQSASSQKRIRIRRGLITGAVYAVFGLALAFACLSHSGAGNKIGAVLRVFLFPGELLLTRFVSSWVIGHGAFIFLYLTNPLVYFIVGFILGALSNGLRQSVILSMLLLLGMTGTGYYLGITLPRIKHQQSIQYYHELFRARLEADPNDISALHAMGFDSFTREGNPNEAARYFERVVQIESPTGSFSSHGQRSLLYLAIINQRLGKSDEAAAYYKKFMETNPKMDNVETYYVKEYRQRAQSTSVTPR